VRTDLLVDELADGVAHHQIGVRPFDHVVPSGRGGQRSARW
jgi:hypothetical protein